MKKGEPPYPSDYRPEIDGLRAVAVLLVILYHARLYINGVVWFKGGYLGVDIFFVISGYLVTKIILREYVDQGLFSLLNFYERRIRRILPALLTVILLLIPFAWIMLLPTQLEEFSGSIISSLFLYSNFFFLGITRSYGAESSLVKPLLHTWSLSIEEQFYLLLPIILIVVGRIGKFGPPVVILILMMGSLGYAQLLGFKTPATNFYFSVSRYWELLAGSLIAILHISGKFEVHRTWAIGISAIGASLITASIVVFDANTVHPSLITLGPVFGTALIILVSSQQDVFGKLLGALPLRALGKVSYSLYLWHFPLFAFVRLRFGDPSLAIKGILIAAAVALAVITYFFIEKPFRNPTRVSRPVLLAFVGTASITILAIGFTIALRNGLPERFVYSGAFANFELDNAKLDLDRRNQAAASGLNTGYYTANKRVLIIGNSHGMDMYNALSQNLAAFPDFGFHYANFGQISCLDEEDRDPFVVRRREKFYNSYEYKLATTVIISTKYNDRLCAPTARLNSDSDFLVLPQIIKHVKKDAKNVLIIGNAAEFGRIKMKYAADYVYDKYKADEVENALAAFSLYKKEADKLFFDTLLAEKLEKINIMVRSIADYNGALYFDRIPMVCDFKLKECSAFTDDGFNTLSGGAHMTVQGAAYFGKRLAADTLFKGLIAK